MHQVCHSPLFAVLFVLLLSPAHAEQDLTALNLDQLMNQPVTTVSRTEERSADVSAAHFVITQEAIRRTGVTNIPDLLRIVPGVQVAQVSSSKWAVSARGFNGRLSNKLLVMIDGRTIYTPNLSGVFWEDQNLIMEDIDRIEVVRGPGASVWGVNAVNGVINIITRHAEATQGTHAQLTVGNEERPIIDVRYGGQVGEGGFYRVYGKYVNRDGYVNELGRDAEDDWSAGRGGFRFDWDSKTGDQVMVQADGYSGEFNDTVSLPSTLASPLQLRTLNSSDGMSLMTRWEHDVSLSTRFALQFNYEHTSREGPSQNEVRDTIDLDFQHESALGMDHLLIWGGGYRFSHDDNGPSTLVTYSPATRNLHLVSAFIQDQARLFDDTVLLTIGSKVQYHSFGGWDYEPTVRALWKVHHRHHLWASFSRAARTPSRTEQNGTLRPFSINLPQPSTLVFSGNPRVGSERVFSYELGYRGAPLDNLTFDLALFYNDYDHLVSSTFGALDRAQTQLLALVDNSEQAQTWGAELAADWQPAETLRLQLAYTYLKSQFQQDRTVIAGPGVTFGQGNRRDPMHQLSLRTSYDPMERVELDLWVRYVDAMPDLTTSLPGFRRGVGSYLGLDARVAWQATSALTLEVIGRNLNQGHHVEFLEELGTFPTQIERSVYGRVTLNIE